MYPFATSFALYHSRDPLALYLTINTHLQHITFFPFDNSIISQFPFFSNASISTFIACSHFSLPSALVKVYGRVMKFIWVRKTLWDGENFSNDIKLDNGCCVHLHVPFLMSTRRSNCQHRHVSQEEQDLISESWFGCLNLHGSRFNHPPPWISKTHSKKAKESQW